MAAAATLLALVGCQAPPPPKAPPPTPSPSPTPEASPTEVAPPSPGPTEAREPAPPPPRPRSPRSRSTLLVQDKRAVLVCIRAWETGGGVLGRANYLDDGAPFFGAYQFSASLWAAYFGDRRPAEVTPTEQDNAALAVLEHDGGIKATRWPPAYRNCRGY